MAQKSILLEIDSTDARIVHVISHLLSCLTRASSRDTFFFTNLQLLPYFDVESQVAFLANIVSYALVECSWPMEDCRRDSICVERLFVERHDDLPGKGRD